MVLIFAPIIRNPFKMNRTIDRHRFARHLTRLWVAGVFALFSLDAAAQVLGSMDIKLKQDTLSEKDVLGRTTPRSSIKGFLEAVGNDKYDIAARYLDFSGMETVEDSAMVAREIEDALTRGIVSSISRISDDPSGDTYDNFPEGVDRIGKVDTDQGQVDVLLTRTEGIAEVPVWLISPETVAAVAAGTIGKTLPIDRILPGWLREGDWFGVPPGQWLVALMLIVLSFLLARGMIYIAVRLLPMAWPRTGVDPAAGVIRAFSVPLALYSAVWFFLFLSRSLGLSIVLRQKLSVLTTIVGIFAILLLLWNLAQFIANFTQNRMVTQGNITGVSIVVFLKKAAKVTIVFVGIIIFLSILGIDITAGLAALGIGGIALALGAQKAVENFVGGIALITDRPVRVGDFCQVGNVTGTIQSIGMRSTRIRTLNRTVVTIPNGQFSSEKIENFAYRDQFWFHPTLAMRFETTPDQIRYILVAVRSLLYSHKMVSPEPARVRFVSIGSDALNLEIFAYVLVSTYDEYLEVQEDLLLRIMDIVKDSGAQFAFPSQTIYFARDGGFSDEKIKETEDKVKKWRSENDMPIPRFPQEKIDELRSTIDFPPEGSTAHKSPKPK